MVERTTGTNRSAGISVQELIKHDSKEVPVYLRQESPMPPGPTFVPTEYYTSPDHHGREMDKLWSRVWQMACHEDDIPDVGDHYPYEIGNRSYLVVRCGPDEIKAFPNACLHRGRLIKEKQGKRTHELRCAFHAWCWNLDGTLKEIPCEWDFPYLDPADQDLPEVPLGRWGRFVFINPDPDCEPFEDFIGELPDHFPLLPIEKRYKRFQVSKVLAANWKVAQDAFAESWHVFSTHPQMLSCFGDPNGQFDAWENFSRQHNPGFTPSPHLEGVRDWGPLEPVDHDRPRERHPFSGAVYELRVDGNIDVTMPNGRAGVFTPEAVWVEGKLGHADLHLCKWVGGPALHESVPEIKLPQSNGQVIERTLPTDLDRAAMVELLAGFRADGAAATRERLRPLIGEVIDEVSDTELNGNIYFNLFPNLMPTSSFGDSAIWFRFRPNGMNPEECIMDVISIAPLPLDGSAPPPTPPDRFIGPDESWTAAPEIGFLSKVLDQDSGNMPFVQRGVHNLASGQVQLADYNETKLRHFYQRLDDFLSAP